VLRALSALTPPTAPASPELSPPKPVTARKTVSATKTPRETRVAKPAETPLRILMVSSEAQPFSKTGGLADVSSALSRALGRLGHDVTLFTPRYRGVQPGQRRGNVRAFIADRWYDAELQEVPLGPGARAMLVDCGPLYDRGGIYSEQRWDYPDNAARFAFLSIAAIEWAASQPQKPDVLHGHDWQAGLLPVYARETPSVFTIHNIAYQGIVEKEWVPRLGLRWQDFHVNGFEFWDRLSLLKAGVKFGHVLTTVSPTYADEIQRPAYGYGFDGVMRSRSDALVGILNGIDVDEWNPARDPYLPAPYDATRLEGKRESKRALLELFGLPADQAAMARPLIGMVSRMVHQKGLDLIAAVAPQLTTLDATFAIIGTGDQRFEDMWRGLAAAAPHRFGVHIGFDERRAHLVEAGADAFLMPSRYEPCGLNQMYSMRYGTVPIVRAVGGLVDTVYPYDPATGQGTGFLFGDYDPWALYAALRRVLETYRQERAWHQLQVNGMKRDFSWERSAAEYVTVYKRVIAARQKS
jgi:starch synthase